jgi:hypothetical protein
MTAGAAWAGLEPKLRVPFGPEHWLNRKEKAADFVLWEGASVSKCKGNQTKFL